MSPAVSIGATVHATPSVTERTYRGNGLRHPKQLRGERFDGEGDSLPIQGTRSIWERLHMAPDESQGNG